MEISHFFCVNFFIAINSDMAGFMLHIFDLEFILIFQNIKNIQGVSFIIRNSELELSVSIPPIETERAFLRNENRHSHPPPRIRPNRAVPPRPAVLRIDLLRETTRNSFSPDPVDRQHHAVSITGSCQSKYFCRPAAIDFADC